MVLGGRGPRSAGDAFLGLETITGKRGLCRALHNPRFQRIVSTFVAEALAGCVAVGRAPDREHVFTLEKLAVLPVHRHCGIGVRLVQEVFTYCRARGGNLVSIALVDSREVLKQWYAEQGFTWVRVETFSHLPFRVCFMEKSFA